MHAANHLESEKERAINLKRGCFLQLSFSSTLVHKCRVSKLDASYDHNKTSSSVKDSLLSRST